MNWVSVKNLKESGGLVKNAVYMVFRPNIVNDDHTDRPIREAAWLGDRFDCFHQPEYAMNIKIPQAMWTQELHERQFGGKI